MQQHPEQLVVRQHERFHCRIAAQIRVMPPCAEQVAFNRSVGDSTGALEATIVDCSRGGLGLELPIFVPRGTLLSVHTPEGGRGGTTAPVEVRVQRTTMLDRSPRYYLGVSYVGSGAEHERAVQALIGSAGRGASNDTASTGTPAREAA